MSNPIVYDVFTGNKMGRLNDVIRTVAPLTETIYVYRFDNETRTTQREQWELGKLQERTTPKGFADFIDGNGCILTSFSTFGLSLSILSQTLNIPVSLLTKTGNRI